VISGAGQYRLRGNSFVKRGSLGAPNQMRENLGASTSRSTAELAFGEGRGGHGHGGAGVPEGTVLKSFAKPSNVGLQVGLVSNDPKQQLILAREMYDNDGISGAVVDVMSRLPFGPFSLSGLPDKSTARPYEKSMDRVRVKSLMRVIAATHLVDGAFLGGGTFDDGDKVWNAVIPYDLLHSTVIPAPFFGATPIVDVEIQQDALRSWRSGDERMKRYLRHLPEDYRIGGIIKLPPENTFYIPYTTLGHVQLGTSFYRKIMLVYILEKALARGTIEMAFRRQRPMLHIQAGDENWEASVTEMQYLADLFQSADLDPLNAIAVTRPGVTPQEVGGLGDMWRWTDSVDVLTNMKMSGLGTPIGLLSGDMALDSVSATLTVFINNLRQFRETLTRLFFYEKFFPYIAITNGHRKDHFDNFFETSNIQSSSNGLVEIGADHEVDMENYFTPTVAWHSSLRPEGDREYLDLLEVLRQAGVPVPIRVLTAAGGLDIHDILNSAEDDIANRQKVADINMKIAELDQTQAPMGADQDQEQGAITPPFPIKGLLNREYDDRLGPYTEINGHRYITTPRERRRRDDKANKLIAEAAKVKSRDIHAPLHVRPRLENQ
jgi:hypothetical protein